MTTVSQNWNPQTFIRHARELRERLWADPQRPRYHLLPPEGFFNDANGALFWKGRYHLFYLARTPIPDPEKPGQERWVEIWDHASSRDLVHWVFHPPALRPRLDGSTPRGMYSGDAIEGAPRPTLIYHVPAQGTCISISNDDELDVWNALPENPVIPEGGGSEEYRVFDPCGWYEKGMYYALIGNKNYRSGYEGDSTSLFRSTDLNRWEYCGPFYQSTRAWTSEVEDAACPDFFALGDKHMLLMHGHRPWGQAHYYLGRYENERFYPEQHGRMNWPGGQLSGPETLLDDQGRRIFFGWIREARPWEPHGWASVMTLPRILSLDADGQLRIEPAPELEALRLNPRRRENVHLNAGSAVALDEAQGMQLELAVEIEPGDAREFGVKVRCSPDGEEETAVTCIPGQKMLRLELAKSTLDPQVKYVRFSRQDEVEGMSDAERYVTAQDAPFELRAGEPLQLRIFLDHSVLEVFANGRQCLTQRIYPSRADSLGVRLFARGGQALVRAVQVWDMETVSPW